MIRLLKPILALWRFCVAPTYRMWAAVGPDGNVLYTTVSNLPEVAADKAMSQGYHFVRVEPVKIVRGTRRQSRSWIELVR